MAEKKKEKQEIAAVSHSLSATAEKVSKGVCAHTCALCFPPSTQFMPNITSHAPCMCIFKEATVYLQSASVSCTRILGKPQTAATGQSHAAINQRPLYVHIERSQEEPKVLIKNSERLYARGGRPLPPRPARGCAHAPANACARPHTRGTCPQRARTQKTQS